MVTNKFCTQLQYHLVMLQLIVLEDQSIHLSLILIAVQILEFLMIWMDDVFLAQVQVNISKMFLQDTYVCMCIHH